MAINMISVRINDEKIKEIKEKIKKLKRGTNNILPKGNKKEKAHYKKNSESIFPNNRILRDLNIDVDEHLEKAGIIQPTKEKSRINTDHSLDKTMKSKDKSEVLNRTREEEIKKTESDKKKTEEDIKSKDKSEKSLVVKKKSEENMSVKKTDENKDNKDNKDNKSEKDKNSKKNDENKDNMSIKKTEENKDKDNMSVKKTDENKDKDKDNKSVKSAKGEQKDKVAEDNKSRNNNNVNNLSNNNISRDEETQPHGIMRKESQLGSITKSIEPRRKVSVLYEPNLNPKFAYRGSLIHIPSEEELKMKEIEECNNQIEELRKNTFEQLYEDFCFFLELDNPKQVITLSLIKQI